MRRFLFVFLFSLILLSACKQEPAQNIYTIDKAIVEDSAMVVSAHPLVSEVGSDILKKGGNAIDATIATQLALAVVYPRAGNIGGGGFMVIRMADGTVNSLDYREKAPLAAHRDLYLDENGEIIDSISRYGHLSVGVPGTVAGLWAAHQKYGQLPWPSLVQPAIDLAKNGFQITSAEAERLNKYQSDFIQFKTQDHLFAEEKEWNAGDILRQEQLEKTLTIIAQNGQDGFYQGTIAEAIVAEMQRGQGIITLEDLKKYTAIWRKPISCNYKNYRVHAMPPPSSGGVALAQMLAMTEMYWSDSLKQHSPASMHLRSEIERRVYADRAEHLGDADFNEIPISFLLDSQYLEQRMHDFDVNKAGNSENILAGSVEVKLESFETTHTSIVDDKGNAVSTTTTLNSNYGSKVFVAEQGFFLNNEMDDFSAKPGVPNQFGLVGAEANAIAPEKRMLSSMTPTIIEKDGNLFMVLGAPGGSTIITAVYQTFINVVEFGNTLEEAVSKPRFHHQWLPDKIWLEEEGFDATTVQALEAKGHDIKWIERMALVKAIQVLPDSTLNGVGDRRHADDDAEGY